MFTFQLATVAAGLIATPAALSGAQERARPVIGDFLATIGGDSSPKTVGADKSIDAPHIQPLARDASDIVAYRFFKENMAVRTPRALGRAREAFGQECLAKGGRLLVDTDLVVQDFKRRRAESLLPPNKPFHVWEADAAVCVASSGHAMGGLVSISERKGMEPSTHNGSTMVVGLLMPSYVRTAVYAYHPRAIGGPTPALMAQNRAGPSEGELTARFQEERRREQEREEAFRRTMDVGTETNCGMVIQVRGPVVEVALPPTRTTPSGQTSFWSKRAVLFPPGPTVCTFGL